ncbi:MAG: prepilin-type N-terminal cleavage/methylation domain-containing protein [Magnetococcales bacterium]|nr:prepilin-type N-terminal cleavage/methylation domain-containing protein [Magnetococcales bacterium]
MTAPRLRLRRDQGGFTLVEVLVAGVLAMILSMALMQLLMESQKMSEVMITSSTMNREARELFEMMSEGGAKDLNANNAITDNERVMGFHGRSYADHLGESNGTELRWENQRMALYNGTAVIRSRETAPFNVTCAALRDPLPQCLGANSPPATNLTAISGYVALSPTSSITNAVAANTTDVWFTVFDPMRTPRDGADRNFALSEYKELYWTSFGRLPDQ